MNRPLSRCVLGLALLVPVTLVGCGGDDDDAGADAPEDTSGGGGASVVVSDNEFEPNDVEVATGSVVTWTFEGAAVHNVTFEDESLGASDNLQEGTYDQTFDEAGSFSYVCTLHPGMDGTVTVAG